ncbi:MAG: hypothetical protein EOP59_17955, partial [Sphingomonadales bacterium]
MSDASIALNRFGLGGRADAPAPADPRRALIDQMARFDARPGAIAALPGTPVIAAAVADYLEELRMVQRDLRQERRAGDAMPEGEAADPARQVRQAGRQQGRDFYMTAAG